MKSFLKNWLPVLVWLGVIFFGSTDLMSAEHTSRFIVPFLRWLKADLSPETLASIHVVFRKCAHVSEYAVLALLLLRAAIVMTNLKRPIPILYVSVLGICLFVAATDEFHQTFVASRGALVTDVLIDGIGAVFGLFVGAIFGMTCSVRIETVPAAHR
jgi:VanZ family protein